MEGVVSFEGQAPSLRKAQSIFVRWKDFYGSHEISLSDGTHLCGTSPLCAIVLKPEDREIYFALHVHGHQCYIEALHEHCDVYLSGRKLFLRKPEMLTEKSPVSVAGRFLVVESTFSVQQSLPFAGEADPVHELTQFLFKAILADLDLKNAENLGGDERLRALAKIRFDALISKLDLPENLAARLPAIEKQLFAEMFGLGPLDDLIEDPTVSEVMVNQRAQIYIERQGQLQLTSFKFSSDQALLNVIERIVSQVGRRIDVSSPIVDARLRDGSRVNAVIPPLALKGPCLTIRKFSKKKLSMDELVSKGSMSSAMAAFIQRIVVEKTNIIISGGTGSGKTTLLNVLSSFIPEEERIVTVEDAAELQLQQDHVVSLETRPPNLEGVGGIAIRDLVKNCLRMRPDRIIVGECRGGEALDMLQAMNTGHEGSMTTAHANTPIDMLKRLETMVLMAGFDLPLQAVREQIASAIQVIIQQTRLFSGRRLVTEIAWMKELKQNAYCLVPLFKQNAQGVISNEENIETFWKSREGAHL